MKLNNGKNIILDSDVTVSNGGSLSEVLNQHQSELDQLKSNVKWLYKYGGVGSGTGGGGSIESSKWYILVDVNGTSYLATSNDTGEISIGNLIVNGQDNYKINIKVLRPGGSSFSAKVSWFNGTSTSTIRKSLNSENSWTIEENIYLGGNNTISVQVTDNEYTAILNINYITSPYVFNLELADADGSNSKVSGSDIFIGNIQETGLKAKLSYDIGIEVAEDTEGNKNGVTYTITDILGNVKDTQILDLSQGNKGFIMLDLVDDPNFLLDDNNSATYTYYLTIDVITKGGGTSSTEKFELSFNLIPSSLYLKIIPDIGTIYRTEQIKPEYVYSTGAKSFSITPFFGKNTGKSIVINVSVDGIQQIEDTSIRERQTLTGVTLDINNTEEDVLSHIINFNASYGNITKTFTYYLYSRQLNSNLKWYPVDNNSELKEPDKKNYWRSVTDHTFDLTNMSALLMTSLSDDVVINLKEIPKNPKDFLFAAGILYSEINSSQNPIISLHCRENTGREAYINIYYDKVVLASSVLGSNLSIDCYINKTPYSDFVINSKNYHLFLIYKRLLKHDVDSDDWYYEIAVYIDGVLERTFSTWSKYELGYDQIILHPSNYYINLLELSYFNHALSDEKKYDWMTDANIVRYWYTYQSQKLDVQDLNINILGEFENSVELLLDSKYYDISVLTNSASIKQIAENSKVPILKFSYTEKPDTTSFLDWFVNDSYGENDNIPSKLVGVLYSSGGSELTDIITDGCQFFISIQGSTTRKYRGKNFELSLESIFSDNTYKYIFSPNFKEYKGNNEDVFNTFLPEQSFTLKADAVDSSHSNNTTMGDFINKNTTHFADASLLESTYGKYIKNCLTGFPVLVFIDVTQTNGKSTTYYLGIYNFNLGRKSFFNLGYIDTKVLDDVTDVSDKTTGLKEGFHIYKVLSDRTGLLPSFLTAEVSNNDSHFDFSQYHLSILLRDPDNENDLFGMFGDIETKMTFSELQEVILKMVKSVAKAGHYVFKSIGKNFSDDGGYNEGYSSTIPSDNPDNLIPKNQVPNYKVLFRKELDPNGVTFVKTGEEVFDGTSLDFNSLINPFNTNGTTNNVDYQSLVEYYTICMIFGLFDSVYKNLNIRTWNRDRFYIAFYDMDTCLGVDNAGDDSDYFAFSDYWDSSYEEVEINGEKILRPLDINVYRDFSKTNSHGFDLPSSYLFAIAKYGKIFQNDTTSEDGSTMDLTFPSRLWAKWRNSKKGELRNAEYFIEHYYKHHLHGVDELMLNYNYRTKYFALTKETTGEGRYGNSYDTTNHNKFKGRRLEYVRLWLDGRFHLLDAYFNLPRTNNPIMKLDINTKTWNKVEFYGKELFEPVVDPEEVDGENPDIHVIHSIFGDASRIFGEINFVIKTASHSPLFIIHPGVSTEKRLFKDNNVYYNVFKNSDGYNNQILGGSSQWTELASINGFNNAFYLQSDLLSNLNGDKGTITSWNINLPSIKTISLTSPNYSGELSLPETKNTPDLTSINISNSKISLILNLKPSLKTIIANNCNGANLNILNCININKLSLSGTFGEINIDRIPININLNNIKSTSIRMTANKPDLDLTFSLSNDTTITRLELQGFKSVNVLNCTKLEEVLVSGSNTLFITVTNSLSLESLTKVDLNIENCTLLNLSNNFNLKVLNLTKKNKVTNLDLHNTSINKIVWRDGEGNEEENNEYLDLSYFSEVTTLNLLSNNVVEYIQFKNIKNEPIIISSTFKDCTNLKRVYGNLLINTSNCFKNLKFFSIHGSNPTTYKGRSIYDNGRVIPAYELLGDSTNSNPISDELYQEGNKVTNISFETTYAAGTYRGTNCTLFDIYYTFYNIGNASNCNSMFAYLKSSAFDWTSTVDNSPNRYMFRKAYNITSTAELFRTELEDKKIRLFSPTETEIGLFTPLTNVTNIQGILLGYNYIVDRNVFRLDNELLSFAVEYLLYFNPRVIVDNVDNLEQYPPLDTIEPSILDSWGNISGFFINLTKLKNLGITFDTLYINYEFKFKIPNSVKLMDRSFISTYGKGTMEFSEYFDNESTLESLRGSFRVTEPLPDGTKVSLVLSDDMFDKFKNTITYIGYDESGGDYASDYKHTTFSGNGIEKSLKNGEFPYTITYNLPRLQQFSGIFSGIKTDSLKLPGLMFEFNPLLTDISAAFYNLYTNIELTADGFANCPHLTNASYLFAKELLKEKLDNLKYKISTSIPYRFFYHGEYTRDVLIKGCYESDLQRDEEGRIVYPNVPLEISFQVKTPIATITNLNYCFKNNDINYYTEDFENGGIELNPDYNPFDYVFQNGRWNKNDKKDGRQKLFYWKYNGALNIDSYSPDEYVILDEMKVDRAAYNNEYKIENFSDIAGDVSDMTNFFCSPDLLRYCTSNCNITGLFNSCGKLGAGLYPSEGEQYERLREWGIKGRICPYLLKPVPGVLNLSNFMDNCKGLSNYVLDGSFYLIPKTFFTYTPNINNLNNSFSNIFFAENTQLNGIFSSLKLTLKVKEIFFRCLFPLSVSNVFSDNNVSETTCAFAVSKVVSGDLAPRFEELRVIFENVFKDYSKIKGNSNYLFTFNGYTADNVTHESTKTLSAEESDHNYTTI